MISHKYRCIFIHIPRTAGTSIEHWIAGRDWWQIDPASKHLLASQAKRLYHRYWDEYFKFSFVRNPWDRMISCLAFADFFGLSYSRNGGFCFDGYHKRFGLDIVIENDYRFSDRRDLINEKHQRNSVYGNLLDEELDFIGRFENLETDLRHIQRMMGKKETFNFQCMKWEKRHLDSIAINSIDRDHIENLFRHDLQRFSLAY